MKQYQKKQALERVIHGVFLLLGLVTVGCVLLITIYLIVSGIPAIRKIGLVPFLFGKVWASTSKTNPQYGILPFILTSVYGTAGAIVLGVPIGFFTAVYLAKLAPPRLKSILSSAVSLLSGIPSVVFGLIGFHVVVGLMKSVLHVSTGLGILPGAIVLAVMILPTMTTLSVDGLRAVPDSYRQGSLALGYTRWQTIWHVVLKSAMSSLMTAVILGMTRAFGETLAVRMVIGGIEAMPTSLLSPASTITTTLTTSMAVYAEGSAQDDVLWALGLLLMGMSLIFILIIHLIGRKGAKARG